MRPLEIIENEFGGDWLSKFSSSPGRVKEHPIRRQWNIVKAEMRLASVSKHVTYTEDMYKLFEFSRNLEIARGLPNYKAAVYPKLKSAAFPSAEYEIYVATFNVLKGHQVEFIVPSNEQNVKAADLKIILGQDCVYVECAKKNRYQPSASISGQAWGELSVPILQFLFEANVKYEVIIIVPGVLDLRNQSRLLEYIKNSVRQKREGTEVYRDIDCAISLRRLSESESNGIMFPGNWSIPAATGIELQLDGSTVVNSRCPGRVGFYKVDSHNIRSIVQAFNDSRKQIPSGSRGIVFIELDVTNVKDGDIARYFNLVGAALKTMFTETINTRIGAIVLTSNPLWVEKTEHGQRKFGMLRHINIVQNTYHPLPSVFASKSEIGEATTPVKFELELPTAV